MNILIYEIVNLHMELLNRSRFSIACPIGHAKFPGADAEIILGRNRGHELAYGRVGWAVWRFDFISDSVRVTET